MKSGRVQAGEVVSARLLNRGEAIATYGLALRIERRVGGRWTLDPASPDGPWPKKAGKLQPGGLGVCFHFPVLEDQAEGRYRFTVSVSADRKKMHRSALFQVRAQGEDRSFCQQDPTKDYLAGVERAAPLHRIPASRKLPFAPRGVLVYPIGERPLVGPGAVGFGLADEAINWPRHLNWVLSASLVRVSAEGLPLKILARKKQRLGTRRLNGDRNFGPQFPVPGTPAYYRVDISFKTFDGDLLGAYSEYFRVMKPRFDVDMTVSDRLVRPGQVLRARLKNLGTEPVWTESVVTIEKREPAQWVPVDWVWRDGRVVDARVLVPGGQPGHCFTWKVPADMEGGQFAIVQKLRRSLKDKKGEGVAIAARFKVAGAESPSARVR
ncbi:MAG TPA: hypothetical protein VFS54_12865 [Solirubrobacterales bacterium]|nr:hypothetical protein [Solirubrobacterales bacterium]